jgi:hypothetical protein
MYRWRVSGYLGSGPGWSPVMTMEASRNCVHAKNSVDSSRSGHGGRRPFLTSLGVGLHGMRVLCEYIGFEKFEDDGLAQNGTDSVRAVP